MSFAVGSVINLYPSQRRKSSTNLRSIYHGIAENARPQEYNIGTIAAVGLGLLAAFALPLIQLLRLKEVCSVDDPLDRALQVHRIMSLGLGNSDMYALWWHQQLALVFAAVFIVGCFKKKFALSAAFLIMAFLSWFGLNAWMWSLSSLVSIC